MMRKIFDYFENKSTEKSASKGPEVLTDEIIFDDSSDRTADLQEALISANQALKGKEEALIAREKILDEKEAEITNKINDVSAREKLIDEREREIATKINDINEREKQLAESLNSLKKQQALLEQKIKKPMIDNPEIVDKELEKKNESIKSESGISAELCQRLDKIESFLKETEYKDKIIRELHDDLQKKNRNFYAELTRPSIRSIIRIHEFIAGTLKSAKPKEGEDAEATLKRLQQAVEGNCVMIEDLLDDEYNISIFTPEKGDPYVPKEHAAVISIETDDPELAGTINECRQPGFRENETGKIVKNAVVSVYKLKK